MAYTDRSRPTLQHPRADRPSLRRPAFVGFVLAYLAINVTNSVLTLGYTVLADTPSSQELGVSYLDDPAYQATVVWHPVVALLLSAAAAAWAFRRRRVLHWTLAEAVAVGTVWLVVNALLDALVYVALLGQTRWGLPAYDFYVADQPWIALTYAALFAGPVVARALTRRTDRAA